MILKIVHIFFFLLLGSIISINTTAQIVNIENLRKNTSDTLKFKGTIGSSIFYKNSSEIFYTLSNKVFLCYKNLDDMVLLTGDYSVTKAAEQSIQNEAFGHIRYNRTINSWLIGELFTQIQQNRILDVKSRYLVGLGPRFAIIKNKKIDLFLGPLYMYEYEVPTTEQQIWVKNRMSNYLSFRIKLYDNVFVSGITYYQPNITKWSDYRLTGQYKLSFTISKKISFKLESNVLYDSEPVTGAVNSDNDLTFGLDYSF